MKERETERGWWCVSDQTLNKHGFIPQAAATPTLVPTPATSSTLASFFAARLGDRPSAPAACDGIAALAAATGGAATLPPGAAVEAATALAATVLPAAQSYARSEREAVLAALAALLQPPHAAAIAAAGVDTLGAAAAAVDGERDPRCLLAGLHCIAAAARAAAGGGPPGAATLATSGGEAVDVVGCYFPVQFAPPPGGGPAPVTRSQLVTAVVDALTAAPTFAEAVIPLAVDKLTSGDGDGVSDARALLVAAARAWGGDAVRPSLPRVWAALARDVAAGSSGGGPRPDLTPAADVESPSDAAAATATALASIDSLGPALADAALADPAAAALVTAARARAPLAPGAAASAGAGGGRAGRRRGWWTRCRRSCGRQHAATVGGGGC